MGFNDLVLDPVMRSFVRRSDVDPFCICYSVKFFHVGLRVSLFVLTHLVLLILKMALHDISEDVLFFRGFQVIYCCLVFVILQSFLNVNSFEYSSMQNCHIWGRT